jgi:hypothetical protein
MRKIMFVVPLILSLSSCGIFKKIHKEKSLVKVETKQEIKKDSTGLIIDKSVTVIKEKIDSTVTIPAKTVSQDSELNMDSLVAGMTAIKNDLVDVTLLLNPVTGVLTVAAQLKEQKIPVKIEREITKHNDITQSTHKTEAVLNTSKSIDKSSTVDKEPKNTVWYVVLILAAIALLGWLFKRRY